MKPRTFTSIMYKNHSTFLPKYKKKKWEGKILFIWATTNNNSICDAINECIDDESKSKERKKITKTKTEKQIWKEEKIPKSLSLLFSPFKRISFENKIRWLVDYMNTSIRMNNILYVAVHCDVK